ncbi:MAG: hypothetical protein K0S65_1314 [Labilithrix sp.]|nr:hypothetical protein [Labilithrix sp.]
MAVTHGQNARCASTLMFGSLLIRALASSLVALAGLSVVAPVHAAEGDAGAPEEEPVGFGIAPFAAPAYQDETSLLLGAAAVGFYHHAEAEHRRDSQVLLAGAVSLRKQFSALLSPDLYLANDRVHVGATLSAARFPDRFFGIESRERLSKEEPYTPIYTEVEISPKLRLSSTHYLYVGPAIRYQYANIVERTAGGLLDQRSVTGWDGGHTFQLGARGFWDTRDSTLYPLRGSLVDASFLAGHDALGSDFSFSRTRLDGRHYLPSFWSRHVLAIQALIELRSGSAPFFDLGKLGGSRLLRGHFEGKHRDSQLGAIQVEYRLPVVWRFGAVLFGGVGSVMSSVGDIAKAKAYAAAGGGIRFAPSKKAPINIRLDVAYGDEPRFYLDVGEAF